MTTASTAVIARLVDGVPAGDEVGADHKAQALRWLSETDDIYRRLKPSTPSPHLVAYFLVVDRKTSRVLLCDHRSSGLWLPTGGHIEPGEHPADTVRRETVEELGIEAHFDPVHGVAPFFLTVTETVGPPNERHTDVTLWFALAGDGDQLMRPHHREFAGVRWWGHDELRSAPPTQFEPHLVRALDRV